MIEKKPKTNLKDISLNSFKLTDDFHNRVQELEIMLYEGTLTHENMKELFGLYSVYYFIKM
jgi:hypothetical protein